MLVEKKIELVRKYLHKKCEHNLFEVIIKDYNKTNFYIALVYSSKIEKFKVAFVPLDLMAKDPSEYVCYQFASPTYIDTILKDFTNNEDKCLKAEFRDKASKKITNFKIEITSNIGKQTFFFTATRYIPVEWLFMFNSITILFSYLPNIMSELGTDILALLTNTTTYIDYNISKDFNLFNDDLNTLFETNVFLLEEYNKMLVVSFLEKIDFKYYAIVSGKIVIIDYNVYAEVISCYTEAEDYEKYIYAVILKIRANYKYPFYKLLAPTKNILYLCFGVNKKGFQVIDDSKEKIIPFKLYQEKKIIIKNDYHNELKNKLKEVLKDE